MPHHWSADRRKAAAALSRKWHGAPEGFCTVYRVHVPVEFQAAVRYWAQYVAQSYGSLAARDFVQYHKSLNWRDHKELCEMRDLKTQIYENSLLIRHLPWGISRHGN